ncbi:MAG: transcription elongation factor subunit Spt4 [Candidatus Woesearchaeota archaeon]
MLKKKICKKCHYVYELEKCPQCGSDSFATTAKGRVYIFDTKKSEVGKKMGITLKGEYAIKL